MKKIVVIGAGFSGLAAAITVAGKGHRVTVVDNHEQVGGRARSFERNGFVYDMGPSWYWMPDVFERFFARFGKNVADYYELVRLDPSYRVFFESGDATDIPASFAELRELFERWEPGAAKKLDAFLADAEYKYRVGMDHLVYQPSVSVLEFMRRDVISGLFRLQLLSSFGRHARRYFRDLRILQIIDFPVLFLGAKPENTPALYSLMNFADLRLGTWYPMGGMVEIPGAMRKLAEEMGVTFRLGEEVNGFTWNGKRLAGVKTDSGEIVGDAVISAADYAYTESMLPEEKRNYSGEYWNRRTMSPSSLLFYVGVDKPLPGLQHHNLFFDADFDAHAREIYDTLEWPSHPLFYVCNPSKTDPSVAPEGKENLFFLIPVAAGLEEIGAERKQAYLDQMIGRVEARIGIEFRDQVLHSTSFSVNNFREAYHAYKGNAYGLANTLKQTAFMRPKIVNRKVDNLLYAGQLTVPGPGVPPSLISGQIVGDYLCEKTPWI